MAAKKPRDIQVGLAPNPKGNPPLLFTIDKQKLTFSNNNHPGFLVRFNISDPDNTGYKFPDAVDEAMWVKTIDAVGPDSCPITVMHWSGFKAVAVTNNNMTLEVDNPNPAKQLFAFTLRFTKTPHDASPVCVPFDPIGNNRNGSTRNDSALLLITLAVVSAAAFAAYKLFLS